jgi:hypothetical protein
MSFLGDFLADDESRTAATIYHSILEWLRTAEGMDSGGMVAMMNRADISLRIRTGMANELQQAIMPVEEGAKEALICGGCADEILCVSASVIAKLTVGRLCRVVDARAPKA